MAQIFHYQKDFLSIEKTMKRPLFTKILNDSKITDIDDAGRTAIHNIAPIKNVHTFEDEDIRRGVLVGQEESWISRRNTSSYVIPHAFYEEFYAEVIKRSLNRGCDIDHESIEGKTALHVAVAFNNSRVIIPLLKMGVDINIVDKNGKTALVYCTEATSERRQYFDPWRVEFSANYKYQYDNSNYANKILAVHVYKLEFNGEHVNDQNKQLQRETLEILGPIAEAALDTFHKEVERTKNVNIGNTSLSITLSLYEFLTKPDAYVRDE